MIAIFQSTGDYDLTETTSTTAPVYIPEVDKEKEFIEEELVVKKVNIFKANNRNIVRQNRFSCKGKFRSHRTRNR